jgi:hypothetical protein
MSRNNNDSPDSPDVLAHIAERLTNDDSPRSLCNRGGRVSRRCSQRASELAGENPGEWIPAWAKLPDSVEAIEAGRPPKQLDLLPVDDSRAGRLSRLTAGVRAEAKR